MMSICVSSQATRVGDAFRETLLQKLSINVGMQGLGLSEICRSKAARSNFCP